MIKTVDIRYLSPGLSDTYQQAVANYNSAVRAFKVATQEEIIYQIQYAQKNIQDDGIKNYGITDPLCNIETLFRELI